MSQQSLATGINKIDLSETIATIERETGTTITQKDRHELLLRQKPLLLSKDIIISPHKWKVHGKEVHHTGKLFKSDAGVAVIIIRTVFIGSFLIYCLLLNHSFPTNLNSITNCF